MSLPLLHVLSIIVNGIFIMKPIPIIIKYFVQKSSNNIMFKFNIVYNYVYFFSENE